MKKIIILANLFLTMSHTTFAEQQGVFMQFHSKINSGKNMQVNRAPIRLPIEVIYDSDTHKIKVTGDYSMETEDIFMLPVCMGPCSQKMLEHNEKWSKSICSLRSIDISLNNYLVTDFWVKSMIQKYNE